MTDTLAPFSDPPRKLSLRNWYHRLIARTDVQRRVARLPVFSRLARRDGEAIFDLVAGFVNAQVLLALVELEIFEKLLKGPASVEVLAEGTGVCVPRLERLLRAGVALDLLAMRRGAEFSLARRGAALIGVPGLQAMIRHHGAFYQDLADPVALLRGGQETQLAQIWPYVFGQGAEVGQSIKDIYSDLMADSQVLVADDTLKMVRFGAARRVMDVGGGSGAFALAVARGCPGPELTVFDLPGVSSQAHARFDAAGVGHRLSVVEGSFLSDALPEGADVITLVRVLYDHDNATICDLLQRCFDALPSGGRIVVSEPMTGGQTPSRSGDVYFSFYTMAMQTGMARAPGQIVEHLCAAGFVRPQVPTAPRPFVTSVVLAEKP